MDMLRDGVGMGIARDVMVGLRDALRDGLRDGRRDVERDCRTDDPAGVLVPVECDGV
jgi:hypothetical protein